MEDIYFEAQLCSEIATLKEQSKKQKSKQLRLADRGRLPGSSQKAFRKQTNYTRRVDIGRIYLANCMRGVEISGIHLGKDMRGVNIV